MFDTLNNNLELRSDYTNRYFLGKVVKVDPNNRDRIQASVPGLYDPDSGEVPWAGPLKISPFGQSAAWGVYGSPVVGSDVIIELQDGDAHYPMYSSIMLKANPDFESGTHWGFLDPSGNSLKVNLKTGLIEFVAQSGVTITISESGGITLTTKDKVNVAVSGKLTVTASDTVEMTAPLFKFNGNVHTYGALTNNSTNVGSTHTHSISSGATTTGVPR